MEYEPYDSELAGRVTSLYAQLESLNTTVALQRRDAPRRAAKEYAAQLKNMIQEDEEYEVELEDALLGRGESAQAQSDHDSDRMDVDSDSAANAGSKRDPAWNLEAKLGSEVEGERWKGGDFAGVYEDTLRLLLRLQGEGEDVEVGEGEALATTVGKVERAGRAAEVVEEMMK